MDSFEKANIGSFGFIAKEISTSAKIVIFDKNISETAAKSLEEDGEWFRCRILPIIKMIDELEDMEKWHKERKMVVFEIHVIYFSCV